VCFFFIFCFFYFFVDAVKIETKIGPFLVVYCFGAIETFVTSFFVKLKRFNESGELKKKDEN